MVGSSLGYFVNGVSGISCLWDKHWLCLGSSAPRYLLWCSFQLCLWCLWTMAACPFSKLFITFWMDFFGCNVCDGSAFASCGDDIGYQSCSTALIQLLLKQEKRPIGLNTCWTVYAGYGDVTPQPLPGFFFIAIGCYFTDPTKFLAE